MRIDSVQLAVSAHAGSKGCYLFDLVVQGAPIRRPAATRLNHPRMNGVQLES
jgi:hypothetical protein